METKSIPSGEIFYKDVNVLHMELHTYFVLIMLMKVRQTVFFQVTEFFVQQLFSTRLL